MAVAGPGEPDSSQPSQAKRTRKLLAAAATALFLAMATAIGTGLGSKVLEAFEGEGENEQPPISSSASEVVSECGTRLFVAGDRARRIAAGEAPAPLDWTEFQRVNDGVVAANSVAEVSIQGETSRAITLTGIDFEVDRRRRPPGATFSNPCGDAIHGRYVVADLDREPVTVDTARDPEAVLDPGNPVQGAKGSSYKPISFPWTVSVTDPLLLYVVAATKRCECTWRAEIAWRSGAQSGVIRIDNDGRGYEVVGAEGLPGFTRSSAPSGWALYE